MTDEIALTKALARAARAEALLRDELLVDYLDAMEREYIAAWQRSASRDTDARERLWQAVQVVARVRDHLTSVVINGKLAQREMQDLETLGERRKLFGVV